MAADFEADAMHAFRFIHVAWHVHTRLGCVVRKAEMKDLSVLASPDIHFIAEASELLECHQCIQARWYSIHHLFGTTDTLNGE